MLTVVFTAVVVSLPPHPYQWMIGAEALVVLALVGLLVPYLTGSLRVAADGSHYVWTRCGLSHTMSIYSAECARAVVVHRVQAPWALQRNVNDQPWKGLGTGGRT